MRKGITPVIAMILLILIVVALGGVFAAWTTRTWEGLGETGEEQIGAVTEQLQKSMAIDSVYCNQEGIIYIRNTGSTNINCDEITVYVDDDLQADKYCDGTLNGGTISKSAVGELTGHDPAGAGAPPRPGSWNLEPVTEIRVTVSGNSATYKCR